MTALRNLAARILGPLFARTCVTVDEALVGWDDDDEDVSCQ